MKGHSLAARFVPHLQGNVLAVSFMTVGELYKGAAWARWGENRLKQLETILKTYLVIGADPHVCRHWGELQYERRTRPISSEDAWIAATAVVYQIPLVTHDVADFVGITGLRLLTAV
jgi:tRNA(fMet)-specific endonuclease VapC